MLRRRFLTILLCGVMLAFAGWLIARYERPMYQSRSTLEIQGLNENFLNARDLDPGSPAAASPEYYVETQVRILQDESLIDRVVAKMEMDRRPEFQEQKPGRLASLLRQSGLLPPAPASPRERAAAAASRSLKVRASSQSRIVEIHFDSHDPQLAADFANALANEFIEQNLEYRWKAAQKTGEWLNKRLDEVRTRLDQSAQALQAFSRDSGLIFSDEKGASVAEERLRQVQQEYSLAQADRVAKQSRYEASVTKPIDSLPEVLDSPTLRDYQIKLSELRRQQAELAVNFTPAFPKVKTVRAQIAELESALTGERQAVANRLQSEYATAVRREDLVAETYEKQAAMVTGQTAATVRFQTLKREVETNRNLYESMLQRIKEADIASAIRASNIRVINPAKPPAHPYKPTPLLNASMGLIAGLFLGLAFVLIREHTDHSIRAPGQAPACLGVPEMGVIPVLRPGLKAQVIELTAGYRNLLTRLLGRRTTAKPIPVAGTSQLSESLRATVASILLAGSKGRRACAIVFSSPSPGEGKTTLAANLGVTMAETKRKVLLVDGDMWNPRLHEAFGVPNQRGLSDLLAEQTPVEMYDSADLVHSTGIEGLFVLPAGSSRANLSDISVFERLQELLWRFRIEFHAVLIDTPPILEVCDGRLLGRASDGVILVVRAASTSREQALAARQRLLEDGIPVLGTILNSWIPSRRQYGSYYYPGRRRTA